MRCEVIRRRLLRPADAGGSPKDLGSILKKSALFTALIVAGSLSVAALPAQAATPQIAPTSASTNDGLAEVTRALSEAAPTSPESAKNLATFDALPEASKQKFAEYVNDPVKYLAIVDEFISLSSNSAESESKVLFGGDVVLTSSVTQAQTPAAFSADSISTFASQTNTNRQQFTILGVLMTEVSISMNFNYDSSRITSVNSCTPGAKNYYPLRTLSSKTPDKWLSGNNGVCDVGWDMAIGWVNGVNLGQRSFVHRVVQGPWGLIENSLRS